MLELASGSLVPRPTTTSSASARGRSRRRRGDARRRRRAAASASIAEVAAEAHLDAGVVGDEAVHLPGQVVLHVAGGEQHARHREDPPRAARRQRGEPVADRRPGEFEIAGGEIVVGQPRRATPRRASSNSRIASGSRLPWPHSSTAVSLIALSCCRLRLAALPASMNCRPSACTTRCCCCSPALAIDAVFGDMPAVFRPCPASGRAGRPGDRVLRAASSTARPAATPRAASAASSRSSCWSARAALGWACIDRLCRGSLAGAAVEAVLIGVLRRAAQPLSTMSPRSPRRSTRGGLAGGRQAVTPDRRPRPDKPRRARRRPRRDRKPRGEFQRRRRGAGVLVSAARPAGTFRLQDGEHARQHDRPSLAALSRLRLGGGAPRRSAEPGAGAAQRPACSPARRSFAASARPGQRSRIMLRDGRKHRSPNAGWPEAAMAGALGLALAGPRHYAEGAVDDPWLGDGMPEAAPADIVRALQPLSPRLPDPGGLLLGAWLAAHAHAARLRRGGRAAASKRWRGRGCARDGRRAHRASLRSADRRRSRSVRASKPGEKGTAERVAGEKAVHDSSRRPARRR